jgi:hypothetical protein
MESDKVALISRPQSGSHWPTPKWLSLADPKVALFSRTWVALFSPSSDNKKGMDKQSFNGPSSALAGLCERLDVPRGP